MLTQGCVKRLHFYLLGWQIDLANPAIDSLSRNFQLSWPVPTSKMRPCIALALLGLADAQPHRKSYLIDSLDT